MIYNQTFLEFSFPCLNSPFAPSKFFSSTSKKSVFPFRDGMSQSLFQWLLGFINGCVCACVCFGGRGREGKGMKLMEE